MEWRLKRERTLEVFKILNGYMKILFSLKKDNRTRGHELSNISIGSVKIGYQEVLVLTEDNKGMEQIIYILCKC